MIAQRFGRGVGTHIANGTPATGASFRWEDARGAELPSTSDPAHELRAADVVSQVGIDELERDRVAFADVVAEEDAGDGSVAEEAVDCEVAGAGCPESPAELEEAGQGSEAPGALRLFGNGITRVIGSLDLESQCRAPSWSSARLSRSTFTRGSPRMPTCRPSV